MKIEKKLITPSIAKMLLEANTKNRIPKNPRILQYANDMVNGRWKEDTFECIKVSKTGVILDGQHRLLAVVKSNTPVFFHIVEGLDDEIIDVLDTGCMRNASDVFKISGIQYNTTIPAIIQFYFNLKNQRSTRTSQVNIRKTNAEVLSIFNTNESHWIEVAKESQRLYHSFAKILSTSFIGGFYAYFYDINANDTKDFMNQLCTGKDIKNEAISILRQRLIQEKLSVNKLSFSTKAAFVIKVWNSYRKNEKMKILKFTPSTDNFPVAI